MPAWVYYVVVTQELCGHNKQVPLACNNANPFVIALCLRDTFTVGHKAYLLIP